MGHRADDRPFGFQPWGAILGPLLIYGLGLIFALSRPMIPGLLGGILLLIWAARSLAVGWSSCRGLGLRPAIAWAMLALLLAAGAVVAAPLEAVEGGRPWQGHFAYLSSLALLAAGISVFGARTPGAGAWALLMALLMLLFLLPWLETWGLRGKVAAIDRLRLEAPWSIFYGLLLLAGVTNYLPTSHGAAAGAFGLGLATELVALMFPEWPPTRRAMLWSMFPWLMAFGVVRAAREVVYRRAVEPGLPALWLWFRDGWGVVWALRVRERFNRTAEAAGWPIRLAWEGVVPADPGGPLVIPPEAEATLKGLLRRFATPERLELAARGISPGTVAASPLPPGEGRPEGPG